MVAAPVHQFTVDEYHRLAEIGMLREDERVELLNGQIIHMMPIGPFHGGSVKWLVVFFQDPSHQRWIPSVQDPLHLGEHDEPQPDFMLLKPRSDFYRDAHPTPADVLLLIEVSDSTLLIDREKKLPLYARAGIPEVWIVNLPERVVEVYLKPSAGVYSDSHRVRLGESLAPTAFPDAVVDLTALLG